MRAETIARAQAQLPATREEMEQRLGLKPEAAATSGRPSSEITGAL